MAKYKTLTVWETRSRITLLEEFQGLLVAYFSNSEWDWQVTGRIEQPPAKQARRAINLDLKRAQMAVDDTGVPSVFRVTPPPAIGGFVQNVDLIENVFALGQFQLTADDVISVVERAIGVYQSDLKSAGRRTWNPLWWLSRLLAWIVNLPFKLVGAAGFDAQRVRRSLFGKVFALILYIATVGASVLTILDLLDWLDPVKDWLSRT